MSERVSIEGPVRISTQDRSVPAVAFELMKYLGSAGSSRDERANRVYWLTLYRQCYKAANGDSLEYVLRED